jgi:hypothetical protein
MKKTITIINLFFVLTFFGQTKIYETELSKDKKNVVVNASYISHENKLLLKIVNSKKLNVFDSAMLLDEKGEIKELVNDQKFNFFNYSGSDDSFYVSNNIDINNSNYTYFFKGNKISRKERDKSFDINLFDSNRRITLSGEKEDYPALELLDEKFYMNIFDFKKNVNNRVLLEKPDVKRLKGEDKLILENSYLLGENFNNSFRTLMNQGKFEIITKSIFKDKKKSILYRTIYNDLGKIEKEFNYVVEIEKDKFSYFKTNSNRKNQEHTPSKVYRRSNTSSVSKNITFFEIAIQDLDINEFYIDNENRFLYIYGATSNNEKEPHGVYIQKFDIDGTLIWKNYFLIDDKDGFNQIRQLWKSTNINLQEYLDKNLVLSIQGSKNISSSSLYNHFLTVDKNTGKLINQNKIHTEADHTTIRDSYKSFGFYDYIYTTKNVNFSIDGLMAYTLNEKIKSRIDGYGKPKDEMFFDAFMTSNGIWLIETDNETKYSITLYK